MNLLVKKRRDRHNKTLCATDFFDSCVLSCILFIHKSSFIFYTEESCDRPKFDTSAARKKNKQKKQKTKENKEKVYFRSQILECPSIGQYWNIFGVPVLPENVILTFFRICQCYSETYNTGTQKWSSIVQYSCTSIWDLKYTFSENKNKKQKTKKQNQNKTKTKQNKTLKK